MLFISRATRTLARRPLARRPLWVNCIRLQSRKPDPLQLVHEAKLREIIEGTNFGSEPANKQGKIEEERRKLEREHEVERQRQERQERKEAQLQSQSREDEIAKVNRHTDAEISSTESGKLRGEDTGDSIQQDGLRIENKIIATTENSVDDSEIPTIAKEINETIQEEIGGLPSQKHKNQSAMSKKLTKYLDSAHDTILTVTQALNDVTGYSAIERLKNSIHEQEEDLKQAKNKVKECKAIYGDAIQRRSHSQREVNELLTRKHNWSSRDLERFTELYRNDHENENWEQQCEKNLQDAEMKVDGVQLKLTQSILTRYHEEQIWSDKIRRSSTWGTWILMGLNVLLFIVASFIVEPWKRKKLVAGFEDKVKTVLVGISQQNEAVLAPIIEQLENEPQEAASAANIDMQQQQQQQQQQQEEATVIAEKQQQQQQHTSNEEAQVESAFSLAVMRHPLPLLSEIPITTKVADFISTSWRRVRTTCISSYAALTSPGVQYLQLDKLEFSLYTLIISILSCGLGSLITVWCK